MIKQQTIKQTGGDNDWKVRKNEAKENEKGMLLAELYRLFTVRRLMTGIFLVAIIAVISVSDLISIDSINWPAELKQSICDQLQMTLIFDRYKSLYVIAASYLYGDNLSIRH